VFSFALQALGFLSSYGIGMEYDQAKVKSTLFFFPWDKILLKRNTGYNLFLERLTIVRY
jgi:hypothetical protein